VVTQLGGRGEVFGWASPDYCYMERVKATASCLSWGENAVLRPGKETALMLSFSNGLITEKIGVSGQPAWSATTGVEGGVLISQFLAPLGSKRTWEGDGNDAVLLQGLDKRANRCCQPTRSAKTPGRVVANFHVGQPPTDDSDIHRERPRRLRISSGLNASAGLLAGGGRARQRGGGSGGRPHGALAGAELPHTQPVQAEHAAVQGATDNGAAGASLVAMHPCTHDPEESRLSVSSSKMRSPGESNV